MLGLALILWLLLFFFIFLVIMLGFFGLLKLPLILPHSMKFAVTLRQVYSRCRVEHSSKHPVDQPACCLYTFEIPSNRNKPLRHPIKSLLYCRKSKLYEYHRRRRKSAYL